MGIKVLRAGLSTSIQDMGRYGYASYGVPESGAMDKYAAGMGNILVGNPQNAAFLEIARLGPKIQFFDTYHIAISGLKLEAYLNEEKIAVGEAFIVEKGDVLDIKRVLKGNFAYLAINDGFQTEEVLSGRSMMEGITKKTILQKGDQLFAKPFEASVEEETYSKVHFDKQRYRKSILRFFPGPEFSLLSKEQKGQLAQRTFTVVGDSNRMAFMFRETIARHEISILTTSVLPGTVQLTPDGHLIALMRDAQVTGGYPRVLQLPERQIDILAQKRPGEHLRFSIAQSEVPQM